MNLWFQIILNFIGLLLVQEFIFNNIDLGIYINIYVYVLFILLLPAELSPLAIVLLSGLMGLAVDVFSTGVLGLHMSASLAMGYARSYVLKMVTSASDTPAEVPTIQRAEIRKVITYVTLLVLVHHIVLFTLEAFSIYQMPFVLLRIVLSTTVTVVFIIIFEMFLMKK